MKYRAYSSGWKRYPVTAVILIMVLAGLEPESVAWQGVTAHEETALKLLRKGLQELGAYAALKKLLSAGPRLTGSPQAEAAVGLMVKYMQVSQAARL